MIKRELLEAAPGSVKYIILNVLSQLVRLAGNIGMVFVIAEAVRRLTDRETISAQDLALGAGMIALIGLLRWLMTDCSARTAHLAAADAKRILRRKVYEKLTRLGASYTEKISTGEIVQVCVEGIDQLETYFGRYLPQLFYAMLAQEVGRNAVSPERAERMIAMFGLQGLEDRHPQSLSEGQKRRAGVAAVCASDPKVLFLDEPTVGQDYDHLRQMVESLRILQKESGCAIVTVTHDRRCKEALSDRRIIMKMGRIIR